MPTADYEGKVKRVLEAVEESDKIHDDNADLLHNYRRDKELNGMSAATQQRNLSYLKVVTEHVGDSRFEDMDADDVKDIVAWVHGRDLADATVNTYKKALRQFWIWMNDGEAPPEVDWMKIDSGASTDTLPKDLLTREDIKAQIEAAKNPRDKALISMLYETGARIGELIDLTVGDIEDRDHGKKVVIDGKTGPRRLPLVRSVPHINDWLNKHPNPEKDAPLWCKIQQGGPTEHLTPAGVNDVEAIHGIGPAYAEKLRDAGIEDGSDFVNHDVSEIAEMTGVETATAENWSRQFDSDASLTSDSKLSYRYITKKILDTTMERAGIDKPSNPHHYRHSRASHLATELKEAQLCEWFGWVQGSDVPARYVHLSGRDIDNAYDQMHGLYEPDEEEQKPDIVECPRCEELNEPDAAFCMRCGQALDIDAAKEVETAEEATTENADDEDLQLALQVVEAMKRDRDEVESFVAGLNE